MRQVTLLWNTRIYQGAAWDLIFMANKKQQKKYPTKVTKKDNKKIKPFLDIQKKIKNRVLKYCVTKKVYNLSGKKNKKNAKNGVLKLSLF